MRLFNKRKDDGSFESLVKLINKSKDNRELTKSVQEWVPDIEKYDLSYWRDNIYSKKIKKIDFDKLPIALSDFYKSNDKVKTILFCMILEATIDELPYLTNLYMIRSFPEKWEILKETISTIIKKSNSPLINSIFCILLDNDPTGQYLTEEEKKNVIIGINDKLKNIYDCLSADKMDSNISESIGVLFNASTYLNDEYTRELIEKISEFSLNDEVIVFLLKYQLVNNIDINSDNIDKILDNKALNYIFFNMLDLIGKFDILKDKINQERIAMSKLIYWLMYPTELGGVPADIEKIDTIEIDGLIYYLFKFTDIDGFKDKGYMLGVAGGYEKDKLTVDDTGVVFSDFEQVRDDYENQSLELIEQLQDWFKSKNNKM